MIWSDYGYVLMSACTLKPFMYRLDWITSVCGRYMVSNFNTNHSHSKCLYK